MNKKWLERLQPSLTGKEKWFAIAAIVLLQFIFFFLVTLNNVYTETYDIDRFTTANETIRSPITIENEQETERKVRDAVQQVEDRYSISEQVINERIGYSEEIFEAILTLNEEIDADEAADSEEKAVKLELNDVDKLERLQQALSEPIVENFNNDFYLTLLNTEKNDLLAGRDLFIDTAKEILEEGVRPENVATARTYVKDEIRYAALDPNLKSSLTELSDFIIIENSFFDLDETNEVRKIASSNVDPVMINAGEIIVSEGQVITNEIYEELRLAGLLESGFNVYPIIGLILLLTILSILTTNEINGLIVRQEMNIRKLIAILVISLLVGLIMKVISIFQTGASELFYITPIAVGALLLKLLFNDRFAMVMSVIYAILGSVIFNDQIPGSLNVDTLIYFLIAQLSGVLFLVNVKDRTSILKSGIGMTFVNVATILLFLFLSFENYTWSETLLHASFGLVSAFLAAVLTIGLLPFFETALGTLSDVKLLQLTNPTQPLLKKLLTEAPGTYHHSVMVANLSETACEAIGANGLLARVGAYYHDIGKTVEPHYFIENQLKNNPHDLISAQESAEIIIRHPYEGVKMLKEAKFPKEIIRIAETHHGTSLVSYFYHIEKKKNPDVSEDAFRYPGPKPTTKEEAVISICDSVEAAARSLDNPTEEKIESLVSSIMKNRISDGQLNESPLSFIEMKTIQRTVCDSLKGTYHSRIKYPKKEDG